MTLSGDVESLVERLRPSWAVDEIASRAVSTLLPQNSGLADAMNEWIVANNALKSEAASTLVSLQEENARLREDRDSWRRVAERCKSEAEGHAQEARTANSTIYEIYQSVTGATGEPGNWHGAKPVRDYIERAEAQLKAARERSDTLELTLGSALAHLEHLGVNPEWPTLTGFYKTLNALQPIPEEVGK